MPDETYRLVDTTLNMVIIRLGDILLHAVDDVFLAKPSCISNALTLEEEIKAGLHAFTCTRPHYKKETSYGRQDYRDQSKCVGEEVR
ncbi:MAG: hypothetical protein ABL983_00685 [Nitrospira sp.]